MQDQLGSKNRKDGAAVGPLRNRAKARKHKAFMEAKEGSVEAAEFKHVKDQLMAMKKEHRGNPGS